MYTLNMRLETYVIDKYGVINFESRSDNIIQLVISLLTE